MSGFDEAGRLADIRAKITAETEHYLQTQKDSVQSKIESQVRESAAQILEMKSYKLMNCLVEGEAFKDNQKILQALAKKTNDT